MSTHVDTQVPATLGVLQIWQIALVSLLWGLLSCENVTWTAEKTLRKHCPPRRESTRGGPTAKK